MQISEWRGRWQTIAATMLVFMQCEVWAVTNDLLITSISRDGEFTTLTWTSRPGEFYTVYWTDELKANPFWRVAAVGVPSGGTNTTWSEGGEDWLMSLQVPGRMSMAKAALTAAEMTARQEAMRANVAAGRAFLERQLEVLKAKAAEAQQRRLQRQADLQAGRVSAESGGTLAPKELTQFTESGGTVLETMSSPPEPPGDPGEGGTNAPPTAKFYRVARMAVTGFVDGWGPGAVSKPSGLTNIMAVAASPFDSGAQSLALRSNGTVVAWGNNFYGHTNVPGSATNVVAVAAGGRHSIALKRDGSLALWGDNSFGQVTNAPAGLTNVVEVKAGLWHSVALKANGTVAAWGDQFNRSNAVPSGLSNVIAIAAGPRHCLALKSDHTVAAWGFDIVFRGYYWLTNVEPYALFMGTNPPTGTNGLVWLDAYSATPTNLPAGRTVFGNFLPTNVPANLTNVIAISAGMEHNQALRRDGSIFVWGRTNAAVVTKSPPMTNAVALGAGWHYGVAVNPDAQVMSWGEDESAQSMDAVVSLSVGALHTLLIRTNDQSPVIRRQPHNTAAPVGALTNLTVDATGTPSLSFQWQRYYTNSGWNNLAGKTSATLSFASLQDSDDGLYRVQVSTPTRTVTSREVTVETIHVPVITNQTPELDYRSPPGPTVLLALWVYSKGSEHVGYTWYKDSVPLAGDVLPGGLASSKQLFFTSTNVEGRYWVVACNEAGCVTSAVWQVRITLAGESTMWGAGYAGGTNLFRAETNLISLAAGGGHTLAVRENGTVLGWGSNEYGQASPTNTLTNVVAVSAGYFHSLALRENGTVAGWGYNNEGECMPPADLTNAVAIAAGGFHSLALRNNGTITFWGGNYWGNGNVPSSATNVSALSANYWHNLALRSNGTIVAWGNNDYGQCNVPASATNVVAVAAGYYHSLALRANGTVVGWGYPDAAITSIPANLTNAMRIAAGYGWGLALRNDGTVAAWGVNTYGQTNVPAGLSNTWAIAAGYYHAAALAYNPVLNYPVNPAEDLLLIANTNSADSTNLLNYYLAHRPLVGNANVLKLGTVPAEAYTNGVDFTNQFLPPLLAWYRDHPTKRPAYHLYFIDVPTRFTGDGKEISVAARVRALLQPRSPFISYLNMGQRYIDIAGATNKLEDALHYIDKLARFGSNCSPGKLVISASAGGYANDNYVLDDEARFYPDGTYYEPYSQYPPDVGNVQGGVGSIGVGIPGMLQSGIQSNKIDYVPCVASSNIFTRFGTNLAGYLSWGHYGWLAPYTFNGNVRFYDNAEWYIMGTIESFNGILADFFAHHGDYGEWFSPGAFYRTNYEGTPVGAVCYVWEPNANAVDSGVYLGLWARSKNFITCAWLSSRVPEVTLVVGDPFVRK
ncbi:MAG: hypothetical protein HZA90_00300 [Verrucomicrobia bacterium]|nr:hypothetical protein [Verrucomicrobiota bacterium]